MARSLVPIQDTRRFLQRFWVHLEVVVSEGRLAAMYLQERINLAAVVAGGPLSIIRRPKVFLLQQQTERNLQRLAIKISGQIRQMRIARTTRMLPRPQMAKSRITATLGFRFREVTR